jgi:hypothetical protein
MTWCMYLNLVSGIAIVSHESHFKEVDYLNLVSGIAIVSHESHFKEVD